MAKRIQWSRAEHAYVTGSMGYKDLAKKYGVSFSTLSKVAKDRGWKQKRKEYREDLAKSAIARTCAREADKLESVRAAADEMGKVLEEIMGDRRNLHMFQAVTQDSDKVTYIEEKELTMFNMDSVRSLTKALKDMADVLRNLHGIRTVGEEDAAKLAWQKYELEKKRAEAEDVDKTIEIVMDKGSEGYGE